MSIDPFAAFMRTICLYVEPAEGFAKNLRRVRHDVRTFQPSAKIVTKGTGQDDILIVASGVVVDKKITRKGDVQITGIRLPGDSINADSLGSAYADRSAHAVTSVEILSICPYAMLELRRSCRELEIAIAAIAAAEAAIMREWMVNLGRREAITRLAHLLCELRVRIEARGLSDLFGDGLPLTQQQLSECLGLTTVHLNRMLRKLDADKLIGRAGKRFSILDWDRLQSIGDFDADYLRQWPVQRKRAAKVPALAASSAINGSSAL